MTIETKKGANGRISGYYVDGVKVRKNEIDFHISDAAAKGEIIEVDYYVGQEFRAITRSPYKNLKVVFTGYGETIMTQAAADELGYSVIRKWTGIYFNVYIVEKKATATEADSEEIISTPLVSVDAQDAAIDREIEQASA